METEKMQDDQNDPAIRTKPTPTFSYEQQLREDISHNEKMSYLKEVLAPRSTASGWLTIDILKILIVTSLFILFWIVRLELRHISIVWILANAFQRLVL